MSNEEDNGLVMSTNSAQYFDQDAPPLNKEQLASAVEDLYVKIPKKNLADYPKVIRSYVVPSQKGQDYTNISLFFLPTPQKTKDGKTIYGFVQVLGTYKDEDSAGEAAASIIRNINSRSHIFTGPTGQLLPLTTDEHYARALQNVSDSAENDKKQEEAIKAAENEQNRIQKEIKEREEETKTRELDRDPDSLDYYTMKRVSRLSIAEHVDKQERMMVNNKKKIRELDREISKLTSKHPEYRDMWAKHYNVEREKAGLSLFRPEEHREHDYDERAEHH